MEFEFDKEIDAILRRARTGEVATSAGAHLDADEISAFAENAVSDNARTRFVAHLADCTRCRKILSNTILLNSEAATETASSAVAAPVAAESKTPWYRRFFAFPQLAYTMGAMVLLFSGFFGYLILKNLPGASSSDVSFSTNRTSTERSNAPASAPSAVSTTNANAVSNSSAATNSASVSPMSNTTTSTTNSAPFAANSTTTAATPASPEKSTVPQSNAPVTVAQATPAPEADTSLNATKNEAPRDELAKVSPAAPTAGAASQNRAAVEKQKQETKDLAKSDDKESAIAEEDLRLSRKSMPKSAKKQQSDAGETRSVGGKTFNNVGGIWFDSAVGKQKQKTVRRGTNEYQKLDAGLRSIADQLGGTVVILWNGKAYRIE